MRIGVLGGGQLGRMLALEGIPLGNRFTFLESSPDPPAAAVGTVIPAPYDDPAALDRLADAVDVVTYEFENVPAASAHYLAERVPVFPPPGALDATQDRLAEKRLFEELGIPVAPYRALDAPAELGDALDAVGLPAVIKTRRFGYDGKGQAVVRTSEEAERAVAALGPALIAEGYVPFDRELSVIGVRAADGSRVCYPLTENHHCGGILRTSWAPAPGVDGSLAERAERYTALLMDRLDYVGALAIELFESGGRLVANEIAPRVHNSGHWTLDGTQASQFENHVRAVTGLGLVVPRTPAPTAHAEHHRGDARHCSACRPPGGAPTPLRQGTPPGAQARARQLRRGHRRDASRQGRPAGEAAPAGWPTDNRNLHSAKQS